MRCGFSCLFPSSIKTAFQKDCVDQITARKIKQGFTSIQDAFVIVGSYFMENILPNSILDWLPSEKNSQTDFAKGAK